jgi:hypothetical protein
MTCLGLKPTTCETAYMSVAPVSERYITGSFSFVYFFYGNLATVGSRVIAKEQRVSRRQVERAIQ